MSIWDQYQENDADQTSPFLNKALGDGESMIVQFKKIEQVDQSPDAMFPTADGKEYVLYFLDRHGQEKTIKQNSPKGYFFRAMKNINAEPDKFYQVKKVMSENEFPDGVKMVATWEIKEVSNFEAALDQFNAEREVETINVDEIPF